MIDVTLIYFDNSKRVIELSQDMIKDILEIISTGERFKLIKDVDDIRYKQIA